MYNYSDLIVWQKAMTLVEMVYKYTARFPADEKFGLTGQIRRSAISIPSNIAEGAGRNSTNSFWNFLEIANGSLNELKTQLEISKRLNYDSTVQLEPIFGLCTEIQKNDVFAHNQIQCLLRTINF